MSTAHVILLIIAHQIFCARWPRWDRTAQRKFSTIEDDTGDLKPCYNSTRKFGCRLCHLTPEGGVLTVGLVRQLWVSFLFADSAYCA